MKNHVTKQTETGLQAKNSSFVCAERTEQPNACGSETNFRSSRLNTAMPQSGSTGFEPQLEYWPSYLRTDLLKIQVNSVIATVTKLWAVKQGVPGSGAFPQESDDPFPGVKWPECKT